MVYVSLQELATRIAHRNTGKLIGDPRGLRGHGPRRRDENLHYLFYRDLATAALELNPSAMVVAMEEVVRTFAMPGTGILDFDKHSAAIAEAGIYDATILHEQVLRARDPQPLAGPAPRAADGCRRARPRRVA